MYQSKRPTPRPEMYSQVVVAKGTRLVFVSGQEPEDVDGRLVGRGDFGVQARHVFANLGRALAAAGARPEQVAKITIYVVGYQRDEHLPTIERAQVALFGDHKPANVVMGVAMLSPDCLIEVDAIAVIGSAASPREGRGGIRTAHGLSAAQRVGSVP